MMPPVNWNSAFASVFTVFLHWAVVVALYYISKFIVDFFCKRQQKPPNIFYKIWIYTCCIGVCLLFSALLADRLGTHREGDEDSAFGEPGEIVVDWEPTRQQQWTYGAKRLLVMLPVTVLGAYVAISRDAKLTPAERDKIRYRMRLDALRGGNEM